eukprot:CAMPEP_0174740392 /NCGR_PEP_ID=MMETSP1094-20130205/73464_1 /TAXON_ID=156173 /ORGANISM="Chrysochromulina brevifilum, Strain UTEX LB 985" /LENGTH=112 /DNA_ID=CAMNT_0015944087 /DNA_START=103 /DNA_END=441 /DNA_ORIENTATION=+
MCHAIRRQEECSVAFSSGEIKVRCSDIDVDAIRDRRSAGGACIGGAYNVVQTSTTERVATAKCCIFRVDHADRTVAGSRGRFCAGSRSRKWALLSSILHTLPHLRKAQLRLL